MGQKEKEEYKLLSGGTGEAKAEKQETFVSSAELKEETEEMRHSLGDLVETQDELLH